MNFYDRLAYYLSPPKNASDTIIETSGIKGLYCIISAQCWSLRSFLDSNKECGVRIPEDFWTESFFSAYVEPIAGWLQAIGMPNPILAILADNSAEGIHQTVGKSRPLHSSRISLLRLNVSNHWGHGYTSVEDVDIPFGEKYDRCVWRGTNTGRWASGSDAGPRYRLFKGWVNRVSELCDFGLTAFHSSSLVSLDDADIQLINSFIKPRMGIGEMLRNKLVLVLEGHDVATSLKWVMKSNSVPVMPAPTVESWCMEGTLKPWVHYLPVDKELLNLEQVIDEALQRKSDLLEIAENGKRFMEMFKDDEVEQWLNREVLRTAAVSASALPSSEDRAGFNRW